MNAKQDKAPRGAGRRLVRFLAFGLLNLVVLVVVVALAAPLFFDPNDYKDTIAEQVRQRTGRELTIVGDMSFSVLPWLGVTLGETRLGNAPDFGEQPFARLDSAQLRVKLVPLLSREVRMDTIRVRGLELNLARDRSGRGNWEDLTGAATPHGAGATGGDGGNGAAGDARALAPFALGGVSVEDAAVTYTDAASGERMSLTDVDLRTGAVSIGDPVDADLSLRFNHPQGEGKLAGHARISYDVSARRIAAEGLEMTLQTNVPALGEGTTQARLAGGISYDDTTHVVTARGLEVAIDGPSLPGSGLSGPGALTASADVDLRLLERTIASPNLRVNLPALRHGDIEANAQLQTTLAGNLRTLEVAMDGLRASGEVTGGALGAQPLPVSLAGNVRLDVTGRSAAVSEMRVTAGEFGASGELQASAAENSGMVTGTIAAPPFALRKLLARVGIALPAMRDEQALSSVGLSSRFRLSGRQLNLAALKIELDGAVLQGTAAATLGGAVEVDLTTERLDVDRYLPARSGAAPPSAIGALPVELIRTLNVNARVRVGALRYAGMDLEKVDVGLDARDGRLRLNPLQATLFGGSYRGDVRIDARGDAAVMQLDESVKNVDAHALLEALGADTGALDLRGGRSSIALKATVTADTAGKQVSARGIVLDGTIGGAAFSGGPAPVSLRGDLTVDLDAKRATLAKVTAGFAGLNVATDMNVSFAPGALRYTGAVSTTPFDARRLAGRLGIAMPQTADANAFTKVGGRATVEGSTTEVKASGLTLTVDDSTLAGNLSVTNFADPAFAFDLDVDRLDAERYLPPAAKGKAATPGAAATALPVELVRGLKLDGVLKVGRLTVGGVKMSKVELTAVAKNGVLELSPVGASLYDGRYDGNVKLDARGERPRLSLDETIKGVQIGALLRDVTGDAPVSGATDLRAVLTATVGDSDALKRSLDGNVSFAIRDGALEKVGMVNDMCTTLAALDFDKLNKKTIAAGVIGLILDYQGKGESNAVTAQGSSGDRRTEFTEMNGSARVVKGVARNDDLVMTSPVVRVRGAGTVDLPADRIDYRAEAELVESCAGIGKRDLAGQIIPVSITGPIARPKVKPEIPLGLINALRKRRASEPEAATPAPTVADPPPALNAQDQSAPEQATSPEPQPVPKAKKRSQVLKDARDDLLKGLLQGIIK